MILREIGSSSIDEILKLYFKKINKINVFIILIGANNGEIKDFIGDYLTLENVSGILVEPVNELYEQLKAKFGSNRRFFLENSAIYIKNCNKNIYRVKTSSDLPDWTRGLGSFKKQTVDLHSYIVSEIKDSIIKEKVKCITLNRLLKKYNIEAVNILQIDTEGFDFEIIMSIDIRTFRPDVIIFEYLHLTFYQFFTLIDFLENNNYTVRKDYNNQDAFAIDNNIL